MLHCASLLQHAPLSSKNRRVAYFLEGSGKALVRLKCLLLLSCYCQIDLFYFKCYANILNEEQKITAALTFHLDTEVKLGQEPYSNHTWLFSHFTVNNAKCGAHLYFTVSLRAGIQHVSFWSESHIKTHQRLIVLLNLLEVGGSCGRIQHFLSDTSCNTHWTHAGTKGLETAPVSPVQ